MIKPVAIIAGEPNSISSEIIFKAWQQRKKYSHKPFFVIGSVKLLNLQKKKLNYKFAIKEVKKKFYANDLMGKELPVLNINYFQKKPFENISNKSNRYIFECFNSAVNLINEKKINGIINCPISKESLLTNKHKGITEFLAKKSKVLGNEVMLIYNKKFAVSPITTHIPIREIIGELNKNKIVKKISIINKFYKDNFKLYPKFGVLGLNPHNFSYLKSEEKNIIYPAIKMLKRMKIKVIGPVAPDTAFTFFKKKKIDIAIGMYHDQILSPYKTIYGYDAINITLGLPYIRVSPDHGVAEDIVGKNIANPTSLIKSIQFFNSLK